MSKTLRALIVAATLLMGLFGATNAFASTYPTTAASHVTAGASSAQVSHATPDSAQALAPQAKYSCATTLVPPYYVFTYSCVITSGFVQYVAHCDDDVTLVSTGWLPVGIWRGTLTCASGILFVAKYTQG